MSVQTQIDRLAAAKTAIKTAIEEKGVTVPEATALEGFAPLIEAIQAGGGDENEYFHTTITPATSGEVITVTLADTARAVNAIVVKPFQDDATGITLTMKYPLFSLGIVPSKPPERGNSVKHYCGCVEYRNSSSVVTETLNHAYYRYTVPSGTSFGSSISYWHCPKEGDNPFIKFFTVNGTDGKYGLLVGQTYDIWAILRSDTP